MEIIEIKNEVEKILQKYGEQITANYKARIAKHKKTGNLENSIKFTTITKDSEYSIIINLLHYFQFLNSDTNVGKFLIIKKNITPHRKTLTPKATTTIPKKYELKKNNNMLLSIDDFQNKMITEIQNAIGKKITTEIIIDIKNKI